MDVELRMATKKAKPDPVRCAWASAGLSIAYHDDEWGVPVHDDRTLFEFLILEGAQAGLSWSTILNKRDNYRRAFDRFDPRRVALYDRHKVKKLLADPGIVRNKLKIASTIDNAKAFLARTGRVRDFRSLHLAVRWRQAAVNRWKAGQRLPAQTAESDAMSKDLKRRGFRFVGSTICYAFMQAVGMVNDHAVECFRYRVLQL